MPIEKLKTGGTAPLLKSEDACRIVPSPPSVSTRSIGLAFCAVDLLELSVVYGVCTNEPRITYMETKPQRLWGCLVYPHDRFLFLEIENECDYLCSVIIGKNSAA